MRGRTRCARPWSPHPVLGAGWGFIALALCVPADLPGQANSAGTRILNQAEISYQDPSGTTARQASNQALVVVGQVAGVVLEPPRSAEAVPGSTVVFGHILRNTGNAADSFTVASRPPVGWLARWYLDLNGDGLLDPADVPSAGPIVLAPGAEVRLLLVVEVPGTAAGDRTDSVTSVATSLSEPSVGAQLADQIVVKPVGPTVAVALEKTVDRPTAMTGELLTYTIRYRAIGQGTAANIRLVDPIPAGASYHPASLLLDGSRLTDAADTDAGAFEPEANRVVIVLPSVAAGDSGIVAFQVRADSVRLLANVAASSFMTPVGPDSVMSNVAETIVTERPRATLRKELLGDGHASVGEPVQYRLAYGNRSTRTPIAAAVLTDTLPAGLDFVSSQPAATVSGRMLRWELGDLAPGQAGEVLLTVRVSGEIRDTVALQNRAWLSAPAVNAMDAVAAPLEASGPPSRALLLTKTADALEVGLGETAPFTVVVRNTGSVPVSGLVVYDLLPPDSRYSANSMSGADSARAGGRTLTFYLAGPIAPGASRTIRYAVAVTSAASVVLENTAYATGDSGQVRSEDAVATVRVRPGSPMATRAVIGKVWVDQDGDGVQGPGEPGIEGAEVWTDDGEVATADPEGRFSFLNIRPGRHGFRLDPASIPAAYGLADLRAGADLVTLDVTGWTTPRVTFRMAPRRGRVTAIWARDSVSGLELDSLPGPGAADSILSRSTPPDLLELRLVPPVAGAMELTYPLPAGWELAGDSAGQAPLPGMGRDRDGSPVIRWRADRAPIRSVLLRLRPAGPVTTIEPVRGAPLRQDAERAAVQSRAFLDGPGIEFFSPADGQVLALDRVFVGVRGEAGQPVALFDGDSLLAEATLRPDGVHDFVAVPLAPGPHRLKVRMQNSWSRERWDSISVHVSGQPAGFQLPPLPVRLEADGQTIEPVRVRVVDGWEVPVVTRPLVTVEGTGAEPADPDEDPSSVGIQVRPDTGGWLTLHLRPGRTVTKGRIHLSHGNQAGEFPIEVLATARPLLVAAVGRVGFGASPDAMGAVTVRGQLDGRTSIVASYDSRNLDAGRDAFGRNADPLEEAQYPILGDASAQRTMSASQYQFAARIERGFDWLEVGDISSSGFGQELRLSGYRRALPGIAGRLTTGPVVWQAFGSSTSQRLRQAQIRGAGISGPYHLGGGIRNGTEQVAVEVRAEDNAARVLSREVLIRYVDYQIDYPTGVLLLKRPVPAADTYGNPVFITVLFEAEGGGPNSQVWGVRAALDGSRLLSGGPLDSLRIGATWVEETPGAGDHRILGTDLRLRRNGVLDVGAELSQVQSRDSSGVAVALDGSVTALNGAARLSAAWLSASREFANPSNPALLGGTSEIQLSGELAGSDRALKLAHEWQRFGGQNAERRRSALSLRQAVGPALQVEATAAAEHYRGLSQSEGSVAGELTVRWRPAARWSVWSEARHEFSGEGARLRPDYVGLGAAYDVSRALAVELRHRWAFLPDSTPDYSVTDLGVRSRLGFGTEAYGSYQIAGVNGRQNAALIGLRNQLQLGEAWSLNALVERRVGLDRASVFDPVRALPFVQAEESYWSAGAGAEFLPRQSPYRLSARAEYRDGDLQSTRLATVAGGISLNSSLAVLSRQELLQTEQRQSGTARKSHRYASLWGLAFRPTRSEVLNLLAKVEWIDADQAGFGGLETGPGGQGRTIFAAEAIWQPAVGVELAGRSAYRRAEALVAGSGSTTQSVLAEAVYTGWRGSARLSRLAELRAEARVLREQTSHTTRYDLAPSVVLLPWQPFEVAAGYRFGSLRDQDFAVHGGQGFFVMLGAQVTERSLASAADFWFNRLGRRE